MADKQSAGATGLCHTRQPAPELGSSGAKYLPLELDQTIALMKRVKAAFDPEGLLNPSKFFPD